MFTNQKDCLSFLTLNYLKLNYPADQQFFQLLLALCGCKSWWFYAAVIRNINLCYGFSTKLKILKHSSIFSTVGK